MQRQIADVVNASQERLREARLEAEECFTKSKCVTIFGNGGIREVKGEVWRISRVLSV